MSTPKTVRRWAFLTILAVGISAAIVAIAAHRQRERIRAAPLMTLAEALWTTERDYSRYYAPATRESRSVVEALTQQYPSLADRRFDTYVVYRLGLSEASPTSEPILFIGFDPSSVPLDKRILPR